MLHEEDQEEVTMASSTIFRRFRLAGLTTGGVEEGNGKPPQHMFIPLNNMAEDKTDDVNGILLEWKRKQK